MRGIRSQLQQIDYGVAARLAAHVTRQLQTVDIEIVDTAPSIKSASANARTKPASMSTGLSIQVPEYLSNGKRIRIHIAERLYYLLLYEPMSHAD